MSDSSPKNFRREFMKMAGLGALATLVATRVAAQAKKVVPAAPAAPKVELLKEADPQAQALGYKDDATKVDTKKFPKRASAEGQKQFCWNCQFYQSRSDKPGSVPIAPCTLFQNKGVKAKGWCNSWVSNPNAKA